MTKRIHQPVRRLVLALPIVATFVLQAVSPAQAALPPEYQRVREFEAILKSNELVVRLNYEPIEVIEYVSNDLYRVTAGPCWVDVRIVSDPGPDEEGWVGPRPFHVEVGEAQCE